MILSGQTIKTLEIMKPCNPRTRKFGMTHGVGPAGYDVTVEFDDTGSLPFVRLYPGEFLLASTIERFSMPNDVMGIVHDKSTLARRGIALQNTVIEPGWHGFLTLEITNHGHTDFVIELGMPIAQVVFHRIDRVVDNPYSGKYQHQQRGPVQPID